MTCQKADTEQEEKRDIKSLGTSTFKGLVEDGEVAKAAEIKWLEKCRHTSEILWVQFQITSIK